MMARRLKPFEKMIGVGILSNAKRVGRVKRGKWGERTVPIRKL